MQEMSMQASDAPDEAIQDLLHRLIARTTAQDALLAYFVRVGTEFEFLSATDALRLELQSMMREWDDQRLALLLHEYDSQVWQLGGVRGDR